MNIRRQTGLSLVELMIALVVGLLLLGGVIEIFVANKQTYRVADASARIQENARFATEILGRYLRIAGYRSDPTVDFATAFAPVTYAGYGFTTGQVITGSDDEIVIRYQGDGVMRDCESNTIIPLTTPTSTRFFTDTSGSLQCATDLGPGIGQPLLSDVQQMTIRYGVDTDGDGTANRYDHAAGVTDWNQVVAVRLTLTLQSAEDNTSVTAGNRLQRTYTTTIALRNRLP